LLCKGGYLEDNGGNEMNFRIGLKESWMFAILGLLFFFFSNVTYTIPLATWLAPIFLIRFVRTQTKVRGVVFLYFVIVLLSFIQWKGIIQAPTVLYYLISWLNTTILFIPFVLDRVLHKKLGSFAATLVFPLSLAVIEFATSDWGLHGTWGALAYTQNSNIVLLQMLSITGIYGISFLIGWTSTMINWLWETNFQFNLIRKGLYTYFAVLATILLFGSIRVYVIPDQADTVRVSAISVPQAVEKLDNKALEDVMTNSNPSVENLKAMKDYCDFMIDQLFQKTREQARAGSKIIFWSEMNASVFKKDESAFLNKAANLAKEEHIYLMVAYAALVKPGDPYVENRIAAFNPEGQPVLSYMKTKIPPGDKNKIGDGILQTFDTPYGRIAAAICYDEEFPGFIHQLANKKPDILLIPKQDWDAIVPLHSYQGYMRGIENGFATVQGVYNGLSIAYDFKGNQLSKLDYNKSSDKVLVSEVPTKGTTTIYGLIGDTFAWVCVIVLVLLVGSAIITSRKK
jgi:apolipoprotein N-acyltransferase